VLRGLQEADDFRSAQEWHDSITRGGDAVGLTTVYRTLAALAATGAIDCIVGADGEARYRRCSEGHHHHLVCRVCGATVEVAAPDVEAWATRTADVHGFTDISHTAEIFGRCQDCAGQAAQDASDPPAGPNDPYK
jgi:Fur family ferric uptake transcriptional regulator